MSDTRRLIRQTLTIARRDFVATVMTPMFLLFLLAPLLFAGFGAIGGIGAASVGRGAAGKERIVAIAAPDDAKRLRRADAMIRPGILSEPGLPPLVVVAPNGDPAKQARALLSDSDTDVPSVLYGPLDRPQLVHVRPTSTTAKYMAVLAEQALRDQRAGLTGPLSQPTFTRVARSSTSLGGKSAAGLFAVASLFIVTLMLAGQAVGTMAEERSNKVIEVLAAAVPLESVFLGKLIGMFGVAVLFLAFWATIAANIGALLPAEVASGIAGIAPAVGMPVFVALYIAYFTMAYMLLGSVFLTVGAQASTPREIQMLSLPITIFQMAMFGVALAAVSRPGSWVATAAELFPFSSPFAMAARAATGTDIWPHLAAIAWQLLWVTLTIALGAKLFRRGVLQSAGPKWRWKRLFGR
ncbi:ABC transporter permease [Sphingomonas sp. CFBP 13720]|uniref:ABC transporter permease n=1 Tax=Sphingomonas sp. CFBP 13720 TaxID=2775302 RepID=UPI0017848E0E|nr:ABC transporter permease [Sphingomonas sp. CFBP 13720]MBD8678020.1 ABC transporter permease [Sphingomonas sp. CFBP 13720]